MRRVSLLIIITGLSACIPGKTIRPLASSDVGGGLTPVIPVACSLGSSAFEAVPSELLAGRELWDSTGQLLTGTMANRGAWDLTTAFPGAGYYASVTQTPAGSSIIYGQTVLGVAGTKRTSFDWLVHSNIHRTTGGTPAQILLKDETTAALPSGYREIPDVEKDDEGGDYNNTTPVARPMVVCGTTQGTVADRVSDCQTANVGSHQWVGETHGQAGEGTWTLITRTSGGFEVWRDDRTGLFWSDRLDTTTNWCRASGNQQSNDPYNTCNSNTESFCAESVTLSPAVAGEVWGTGTYAEAKGGMGKTATASSPSVVWRLPTLRDYFQADIHGLRQVLPRLGSEWTATTYSKYRGNAWFFDTASNDSIGTWDRSFSRGVRCVGRVVGP